MLEIVRRAQNRGYLTLSRLADYLASARTEEESPAVLEAVDAVSLMTVHAAKGLEFDTVFLVNMHQRTRRDTSLPRIVELPDGRVEVSALASVETDDELPNRVEEEEKRLLYVALTRARRNLVLSAVVNEEIESENSFARLLPESLYSMLESAATSNEPETVWNGHTLRVLHATEGRAYQEDEPELDRRLDLEPVTSRHEVTSTAHRDPMTYRRLLAQHPVDGEAHYDIPFSIARGARIQRGVIGCAVVTDERVIVVDDTSANVDAALYAARTIFPDRELEAHIVERDGGVRVVRPAASEDAEPEEQLDLF